MRQISMQDNYSIVVKSKVTFTIDAKWNELLI